MKPNTILIVLLGALGDVVRGMHVADAIKSWSPETKIHWLVEPKCKGIVELSPSIDKVIVFDRPNPITGFLNLRKTLNAQQKDGGYDICLDMQRHLKSGIFNLLSKAKRKIGFHKKNTKEFNHFFSSETISKVSDLENKFYHYQEFLKVIDCPVPSTSTTLLRIEPSNPVYSYNLKPKHYSFCVLGSSWDSKNWVYDGYVQVLNELGQQKEPVVLVGTKDQSILAESLLKGISQVSNENNIISLVGKTSLSQLGAIISEARCGFGPDSGPGHLASAFNVPYVSLFGPTTPERVAPIGQEHLVVTSGIGCQGCYNRVCPGLDKLCMRLIRIKDVMHSLNIASKGAIN